MPNQKSTTRWSRKDVASHNTVDNLWTIIDNDVYNLTNFIPSHPGGRILLNAAGSDCTALFYANHLSQKASKLIQSSHFIQQYHVGRTTADEKYNYLFNSPFYTELKNEIRKLFKKNGWKKSRGWPIILWASSISLLACISYMCFLNQPSITSVIAYAFFMYLLQVNIMHTCNHGGFYPKHPISFLLNHSLDLAGQSCLAWRMEHNMNHHQLLGSQWDSEKAQQPVLRLHPTQASNWYNRFQSTYFPSLFLLFGPMGSIKDFSLFSHQHQLGHVHFADLVGYISAKLIYLISQIILPIAQHGLIKGGLAVVCFHVLAGLLVIGSIFANHTGADCDYYDKPDGRDWAKTQAESSTNFCSGNRFTNLLTGGLSQQIEHHLFPSMNPIYFPMVSKTVRRLCKKHGVRYNNQTNFLAMARKYQQRLQHFSELPNAKLS